MQQNSQILVTLTGASGAGKTELLNTLCDHFPFKRIVSVTTREKRPGEVEGKDYYYISAQKFQELEDAGQLVQKVNFMGRRYATTRDELTHILESGFIPIVIVEPSGLPQFKKICDMLEIRLVSVFLRIELDTALSRYVARLPSLVPREQMLYHLNRLSALHSEVRWDWSHDDYQFIFDNNENDLLALNKIATSLANEIGKLCQAEVNQ